jgi:hypothetical protein
VLEQLADGILGPGTESQGWAKRMREQWETRTKGVTRVLQSAAALRHKRGVYTQPYVSLHTRRQWMRYQSYRRRSLPIDSGITEAALQDCLHAAAQALRDGVDERGRTSHSGPAGDLGVRLSKGGGPGDDITTR